ncbi:MAG: L,D-transpeptidase [Chthoniobacteraceae bacterium]
MQATTSKLIRALTATLCLIAGIALAQDDAPPAPPPPPVEILISVADQKMMVLRDGGVVAKYKVSTSRFGEGDSYGSYKTPLGKLRVYDKIGGDLTPGAVIKHRSATGEVLQVNAPGRDPIVTRVIWLDGMEDENHNAKARGIYIHGTPEEANLGRPVSWGCIRMRSEDVIALYNEIGTGTPVTISPDKLPHLPKYKAPPPPRPEPPPDIIVSSTPPPMAKQTPPPAPVEKEIAKATPVPKSQKLLPVSEHIAASKPLPKPTPDKDSPTMRISREIAALNAEADKPAPKASSNPEAWRSMKGSILSAGMFNAPVAPVNPATTVPVATAHAQADDAAKTPQ